MNSWMPAQDNQNGFRNGTCLTPREELPWRSDANANLHVRTLHWNINFLHRTVWNEILTLEIFYSSFKKNPLFFTVPSLWIMADHSAIISRTLLKIFLFFLKLSLSKQWPSYLYLLSITCVCHRIQQLRIFPLSFIY